MRAASISGQASAPPVRPAANHVTSAPAKLPTQAPNTSASGPTAPLSFVPGMTWASSRILDSYTRANEARLRSADGATSTDVVVHTATGDHSVRMWEKRGQGPLATLVVFHGMGGAAATHRPIIGGFGERFRRLVFIEAPGHGSSTAVGLLQGAPPATPFRCAERVMHIVRAALDAQLAGETDIMLLGHSLGGYLAVRYANESIHKSAVRGVALVSPDGGPYTAEQLEQARVASYVGDSWWKASAMARHIWPNEPLKGQALAPFVQATYATPPLRYLLQSDLFQPELTPAQLGALPPTCFVWGTAEAMQLPEHFDYFRTHLPAGHRVVRPEGLNHGGFTEAPPNMMAPLLDFFGRCMAKS